MEKLFITYRGKEIELTPEMSGMQTGWAIIDNPYYHGDPEWRRKDGDTVMGVPADHPRAMPVQEAYQQFYSEMEIEDKIREEEFAEWDRQYKRQFVSPQEEKEESLYAIQDQLMR